MRAIVIEKFGGPDSLVYTELPEPEPEAGHVVIEIKAFGLNHAEVHMRRGEWAEAAKVSGIECWWSCMPEWQPIPIGVRSGADVPCARSCSALIEGESA